MMPRDRARESRAKWQLTSLLSESAGRRRLVAGQGQEPLLGSLHPPPMEVRFGVARDPTVAQKREKFHMPAGWRRPSTHA